jgi:hypothetical protein
LAEIVPVTSEALEAQVRNLLPSQRGFGEDLQASNVITPIIDLTAAAQGSQIPTLLQTALAFGSQTTFSVSGSSTVILNTPGFFRIFGTISAKPAGVNPVDARFDMSDGLSTKVIYKLTQPPNTNESAISTEYDFVVFLTAGISVTAVSTSSICFNTGSSRQIADVNGNLVYPVGYTPQ